MNEGSIARLLTTLSEINGKLFGDFEVVFVVDGSPDKSFELLRIELNNLDFSAQLLLHSRNFGSLAAVRTGLTAARGDYYGVMAADLQEPPELLISFFQALSQNECDVTIGTREGRRDPVFSKIASSIFWGLYRRLVIPDMPKGGVDIFGCNRIFRDQLLKLEESRSSLIALIFWLGFRRKFVNYERLERQEGKSSWTFSKKVDYMMDSIFAFTDYPIRLLIKAGLIGCMLSILLGGLIFAAHLSGQINVPGYAPTMLVVLFFGMLNILGLGLVGTYAWRGYENSKHRPSSVIAAIINNDKCN
jgi:glycosyltransferase involved in cell wall biosynthesis